MVTDIEQARKNYMADYTPVDLTDAHKLLELAKKLQNEDISINTYELYKHPEAREKLFWQIAEATYMLLEDTGELQGATPTDEHLKTFVDYLEEKFNNIIKKLIAGTDVAKLQGFLEAVEKDNPHLTKQQKGQLLKDTVVTELFKLWIKRRSK